MTNLSRRGGVAAAAAVIGLGSSVLVAGLAAPAQALEATAVKVRTKIGPAVSTPFGPVQVKVKVRGKKILSATAIQYPNMDRRSAQINAYAIPELQQQAVTAQSARLDGVSGASWSTMAFAQSLQSALTSLGIK